MIKKNIIATLSVMTALSSFSFAEQAVPVQVPAKQIQKTISAENKKLYDFYNEQFKKIIEKYATIKKPIRNKNAWDIFTRKHFKD